MAECECFTKREYILKLTSEEAVYLKELLQNPLTEDVEPFHIREYREAIFTALYESEVD